LFTTPIDWVLQGFSCEPSGFSRSAFTVQAFSQPLYVPKDHLAFVAGGRLGTLGGAAERWWSYGTDREQEIAEEVLSYIEREGLPFMAATRNPHDVALYLQRRKRKGLLPHGEDEGYSWFLAGDEDKAQGVLSEVARSVAPDAPEWMLQARQRIETVLEMLERRDASAVSQLLQRWRDATISALGLQKFASSSLTALSAG
jgi:hypothetical protein